MEIGERTNPWAELDALVLGATSAPLTELAGLTAFYGRCSTEDHQDPETSRGWQRGNAAAFVEPRGGTLIEEFFDVGQSRLVPWPRRPQAGRLLAALKSPDRQWTAVVVGEGTRCWFGNQFSLIAPRFAAYGVELWVPELGGRYDARNPSHKMLMSVLGGMSESERQHVQARVRAAMDAQVVNEGRHQGGRAPYGYNVVNGAVHPHPRKAAEGQRLRVLEVDKVSAIVVQRIFAEYLDGRGDRAIAAALNRDCVPCPSARRPDQNSHRLADGWHGSTVRSILENPRYTGYATFGRWTKQEMLLDPDDAGVGHVVRFRRAELHTVVRSREPAHPQIVSVETFTQVQLLRRSRGTGGLRLSSKLERERGEGKRPFLLRGLLRCALCQRKMYGSVSHNVVYYRCVAKTLAPGSPARRGHPKTINLREDVAVSAFYHWLTEVFSQENLGETVTALIASLEIVDRGAGAPSSLATKLNDAELRMRRYQAAIEAGANPATLVDAMNGAQLVIQTARAGLGSLLATKVPVVADVRAKMVNWGKVVEVISSATPEVVAELYRHLHPNLSYDHAANVFTAELSVAVLGNSSERRMTVRRKLDLVRH